MHGMKIVEVPFCNNNNAKKDDVFVLGKVSKSTLGSNGKYWEGKRVDPYHFPPHS